MENKKGIITGVLIGIFGVLSILLVLFATGTIGFNQKNDDKNNHVNQMPNEIDYKEYTTYDEVTLSDGSKWSVIENSSKDSDYVTLLKKEEIDITGDEYDQLANEFYGSKITYANSKLNKYIQSLTSNIPVKLKEVNGYKIRLITVDEMIKMDNQWNYSKEHDSYTYTGKNFNKDLFVGLTMTETKCTTGKCTTFYVTNASYEPNEDGSRNYYIDHYASGLPSVKPVINVYKTELEKK